MKDASWFAPPWMVFPALECASMGWRMGAGECFLEEWSRWWHSLPPEGQTEYRQLFPEPVPWRVRSSNPELMFRHRHLILPLWREGGKPRYTRQLALTAEAAGTLPQAVPFWGHTPAKDGSMTKACFSQWWQSEFVFGGITYTSMEQCMMAGKALLFADLETCDAIMAASDPKQIKALGRKVTPFIEGEWNEVKHSLIVNGNYAKFTQNEALRRFLLSTGDGLLVEASPYDCIWGIGLAPDDPDVQHPSKWRGENLLGFALMEVRDEIRRVYANAALCNGSLQRWRG